MKRDIGYIAQRSSNHGLVTKFLMALPQGTLESGVENIPNYEMLKKQFKLRSPKMTKALIRLGVDADVVAGYYAQFNSSRRNDVARVYHMTTFPHPEIMHSQGDSKHYDSCMRAEGNANDGREGAYYLDYIHDDIEAYKAGDLAMFVVGTPHCDVIADNTEEILLRGDRNGGYKARVKVRILYEDDGCATKPDAAGYSTINVASLKPVALLIDRIYGDYGLLLSNFKVLEAWNEATYNLPFIKCGLPGRFSPVEHPTMSKFFGDDQSRFLIYPHDGYMDTLSSANVKTLEGLSKVVSLFTPVSSPLFVVFSSIAEASIQRQCYERSKEYRYTQPRQPRDVYYEAASGKFAVKPPTKKEPRYSLFSTFCEDRSYCDVLHLHRATFVHKVISALVARAHKAQNHPYLTRVSLSRWDGEGGLIKIWFPFTEFNDFKETMLLVEFKKTSPGVYSITQRSLYDLSLCDPENREIASKIVEMLPSTVDLNVAARARFKVGAYNRLLTKLNK